MNKHKLVLLRHGESQWNLENRFTGWADVGLSEKGIGGKTCLQCHQNGGYTAQFKAYAAVTPHPDYLNSLFLSVLHVPVRLGNDVHAADSSSHAGRNHR